MAEKRSVYLSDCALALPRRRDSLSGRINQIAARYCVLMHERGPPLRASFSAADWAALLDAGAALPGADCLAALDAAILSEHPDLAARIGAMSNAQRIILAELLEAEL